MRILVLGALLLAGCAGSVFSGEGRTSAGSGLSETDHITGFSCPNNTFQGAMDAASITWECDDNGHKEKITVKGANASSALTDALAAQAAQIKAIADLLGKLVPLIPNPVP